MKKDFEEEVLKIAKAYESQRKCDAIMTMFRQPSTPEKPKRALFELLLPEKEDDDKGNATTTGALGTSTNMTNLMGDVYSYMDVVVHDECASYFRELTLDLMVIDFGKFDLMSYWREKREASKFPNVRKCARKWLSVPAMSTPSKRVWSICGMIDSANRNRLDGKKLEAQAMVHNNYYSMASEHSAIEKRTIEAMDVRRAKRSKRRQSI
jgi:hypothetical protein